MEINIQPISKNPTKWRSRLSSRLQMLEIIAMYKKRGASISVLNGSYNFFQQIMNSDRATVVLN